MTLDRATMEAVRRLRPDKGNARTHSKKQIKQPASVTAAFRKAVKTHGDSLDRVSLRRTKVAGRTHPIAMEWVNLRELKPNPTNARKHSRQQIRKLARDIQKNSFVNPILITQDGNIVAGHARLEAAQLAGLPEVPVI